MPKPPQTELGMLVFGMAAKQDWPRQRADGPYMIYCANGRGSDYPPCTFQAWKHLVVGHGGNLHKNSLSAHETRGEAIFA